jgi:hypothetical protein
VPTVHTESVPPFGRETTAPSPRSQRSRQPGAAPPGEESSLEGIGRAKAQQTPAPALLPLCCPWWRLRRGCRLQPQTARASASRLSVRRLQLGYVGAAPPALLSLCFAPRTHRARDKARELHELAAAASTSGILTPSVSARRRSDNPITRDNGKPRCSESASSSARSFGSGR